jgi:hypothetical protein
VLAAVLVVGLLAFSATFLSTLDALAARATVTAAQAEAEAEGALAVAAGAVLDAWDAGDPTPFGTLGPWPASGVRGTAEVVVLGPDEARIRASATVGRSVVRRSVALVKGASGVVRAVGWE